MSTLTDNPVHRSTRDRHLQTINRPLCVDLDGTLIRTDLLLEQLLILLKQSPGTLFLMVWWFLRGRSVLKREVASRVNLPVEMLPYRDEVLEFVGSEHRRGRQVLLVTAADQAVAERVAAYIGEFDGVYGSSGSVNLKGQVKAGFLTGLLGNGNFDYIGDSYSDLPVWKAAGSALVVGSQETAKRVARDTPVAQVFESQGPSFIAWFHSIRLLHWSKNLLVLLPVLLGHKFGWHAWRDSLLGFVLFGACASGLYILNDLLDLHSDRRHPSKSKRPFAAGEFPLWVGFLESTLLVGISFACALVINLKFAAVLMGYAVLTVTYSWKLKKIPLLDVFILSSFYSLRIWAGASISSTPVSEWFSAFCLFFFLSLAMAKRHSELQRAREFVEDGNSGRGYVVKDRELLAMFGVASSFAAVVILCLYVRGAEVTALYSDPSQLLWLCPIVLYWLARVWLLSGRGELDLDPVLFAIRDRVSWILAAIAIVDLAIGGIRTK